MNIYTRIMEKIKMYEASNYGNTPTSIVVSRDIYKELQSVREYSVDFNEDKAFGVLISVLQGNKNNQILMFGK